MRQKAFDFATEVVGDVNRMAEAFGKGSSPDDLMVASWNDLKVMRYVSPFFWYLFNECLHCRDIVNDVCEWAYTTMVWEILSSNGLEMADR
jgi:hypothetical protein